ncbi:hypothetical protein PROFUN_10764 [Planoprotostelium fungivorum]|uniref:SAM domain-containing protein n=1 Tax=Planoprotostelium fungivorum TaxID=1890364 RepID=A0A2P6N811_9EUKA|nr:hypothetical protein PROFUN_10764 [Planoprotostelium fungivorum]
MSTTPQSQKEKSGKNRTPRTSRANEGQESPDTARSAQSEPQQGTPTQGRNNNAPAEQGLSLKEQQELRQANEKKREEHHKNAAANQSTPQSKRPAHLQQTENGGQEETEEDQRRPRGRGGNSSRGGYKQGGKEYRPKNRNDNQPNTQPETEDKPKSEDGPRFKRNNRREDNEYDRSASNTNTGRQQSQSQLREETSQQAPVRREPTKPQTKNEPSKLQQQRQNNQEPDPHKSNEWTVEDVTAWLDSVGFKRYSNAFSKQQIHGGNIFYLNEGHLKEDLGVTLLGHRIDLINEIRSLPNQPKRSYGKFGKN